MLAVDEPLAYHLQARVVPRLRAVLRAQVVQRIGAPLPLEPLFARGLVDQPLLDLEAHRAGEVLRALAHEQMMIGLVGDQLGDPRRRADALDPRDGAGAFPGAVHARRIELHDALGVRQTAPTDARLVWIELDDRDAGDERIEHVGAARHHLERLRHAGDAVGVLRPVAVGRRDNARLDAFRCQHRGCLSEQWLGCGGGGSGRGGRRADEVTAVQLLHKTSHLVIG